MKAAADDYRRLFVEGAWRITAINVDVDVGSDLIIAISLTSESGKNAQVSFVGARHLRLLQKNPVFLGQQCLEGVGRPGLFLQTLTTRMICSDGVTDSTATAMMQHHAARSVRGHMLPSPSSWRPSDHCE